jgi:hypothetical protein
LQHGGQHVSAYRTAPIPKQFGGHCSGNVVQLPDGIVDERSAFVLRETSSRRAPVPDVAMDESDGIIIEIELVEPRLDDGEKLWQHQIRLVGV